MQTPDLQVDSRFDKEIALKQDNPAQKFTLLDISKLKTTTEKLVGYRINALGSFYFFSKVVLRHNRFVDRLHKPIAEIVENYHLKEVIEFPRDHFKTTIFTESAPMWWALPFTDSDEYYFRQLGYDDSYIRWMRRAHDRNTTTVCISENITNASKLGQRINAHYESNDLFRGLFSEILPDESCKWTEQSMTHKRTKGTTHGEGTYDCLGIGGALQSRHYKRCIKDDPVGRKALNSEVVMNDTIEYHKLTVGAFDSSEDDRIVGNDEIVVNNRWSEKDLSQWIRDNEPYFHFHNHSALGGCCEAHPIGTPIFKEEFSLEILDQWKARLGPYLFSCQFLNDPIARGATRWNEELLNYYSYRIMDSRQDINGNFIDPRVKIVHETKNGIVLKDLMPRELKIGIVCDPNHAQNKGRCRHAITVTGLHEPTGNVYLLDCWAESSSYEDLVNKYFELAIKWKLRKGYLETVAAQNLLKFHLDYVKANKGLAWFQIEPLKTDRAENAKAARIESMDPFYDGNRFWCNRHDINFIDEFRKYPVGRTLDILDTIGYAPQTWGGVANSADIQALVTKWNQNNPFAPNIVQGGEGRSQITGY